MSAVQMHVQCHLIKGRAHRHAWIPARAAIVGKVLSLKEADGTWTEDWVVVEAAKAAALPSEVVLKHERDYRNIRQVTDI